MTDYTDYFDEVIQAHVAIEQWLAEERDDSELEQLLSRFSPQFSMISPLGRVLDFEALSELFQMAGGKKLGFGSSSVNYAVSRCMTAARW